MKLPDEVRARLRALEWDNRRNLSGRMLGMREWPIRVALNPPTGVKAVGRLEEFRAFVLAWKGVRSDAWCVVEEDRRMRGLDVQSVPTHLVISDLQGLASFIGSDAERELGLILEGLARVDTGWAATWSRFPEEVASLDPRTLEAISVTLVQLRGLRGKSLYLRGLPLQGAGTKVIEQNEALITRLLDAHYDGEIGDAGGLHAWLGVQPIENDGLLVRPLHPDVRERFNNARVLKIGWRSLEGLRWPADTLFVVENFESVFALPEIEGAVAVAGTGGNIEWLGSVADAFERIIYWGDVDYDGFRLLARARTIAPKTRSMLMTEGAIKPFLDRASEDDTGMHSGVDEDVLTGSERVLFRLVSKSHPGVRLEQEKLDGQWIAQAALEAAAGEFG